MRRRAFFKLFGVAPAVALVRTHHIKAEDIRGINFGYGHTITADTLTYTDSAGHTPAELAVLGDEDIATGIAYHP